MKTVIEKLINNRIFRYIFIGGCTTAVNFAAFFIFCHLLGFDQSVTMINVANVISIILAILFAYVANKLFVFQSRVSTKKELIMEMVKFFSGRGFTMLVEVAGVWLAVQVFSWNEYLGKILTNVLVLILNYLISAFLVFRDQQKKDSKS